LYLYTRHSLREIIERAGFTVWQLSTTPLSSPFIFLASRAIASKGSYNMDSSAPLGERLLSEGYCYLKWALLKWNPNLGEELILIGGK